MRPFLTLFLLLIFVISCTHEVLKQKEIGPWLSSISGNKPPEINITGRWHDPQGDSLFAWGEGYLRQEQNRITGVIGSYDIEGIVSGKTVYLVLTYGTRVHYTARLEILGELLTGYYFDAADREQNRGSRTSFIRTIGPSKQ